MSLQTLVIEQRLAARRVEVFNSRYRVGDAVMYIPGPGEEPMWERTYAPAYVQAGRSVVALAGQFDSVDTDKLYSPPAELMPERCPEARLRLWPVALAFVLGMVASVLLALSMPAKATAPENIVIDCTEPGEMPLVDQDGREQA